MLYGSIRRLLLLGTFVLVGAVVATAANAGTYIVLYKQQSVSSSAAATITQAGGSVVATYPAIGVIVAKSDSASFRSALLKDNRIWGAASTGSFGVHVDGSLEASGPPVGGTSL
jgi:lantibiotic leader peptide-processing serine protease